MMSFQFKRPPLVSHDIKKYSYVQSPCGTNSTRTSSNSTNPAPLHTNGAERNESKSPRSVFVHISPTLITNKGKLMQSHVNTFYPLKQPFTFVILLVLAFGFTIRLPRDYRWRNEMNCEWRSPILCLSCERTKR